MDFFKHLLSFFFPSITIYVPPYGTCEAILNHHAPSTFIPDVHPFGSNWFHIFHYNDISPYIVATNEQFDMSKPQHLSFRYVDHVKDANVRVSFPLENDYVHVKIPLLP